MSLTIRFYGLFKGVIGRLDRYKGCSGAWSERPVGDVGYGERFSGRDSDGGLSAA